MWCRTALCSVQAVYPGASPGVDADPTNQPSTKNACFHRVGCYAFIRRECRTPLSTNRGWRREHPGEDIPDRHVLTQPWPAGPSSKRRDQVICYQYKAGRARRRLRGIDEQVAKAAKAVAGLAPVKRNLFIQLDGATKSVNRELEQKARTLAGIKGYVTNLAACPDGTPVTAEFVIGSYHRLFEIESPSACRSPTCRPGPSTTASETRSRRTSSLSSPPSPSAAGSRPAPAGQSGSSSVPPAATAPSRSRLAPAPSPPQTRSPTTSATPSKPSTTPV